MALLAYSGLSKSATGASQHNVGVHTGGQSKPSWLAVSWTYSNRNWLSGSAISTGGFIVLIAPVIVCTRTTMLHLLTNTMNSVCTLALNIDELAVSFGTANWGRWYPPTLAPFRCTKRNRPDIKDLLITIINSSQSNQSTNQSLSACDRKLLHNHQFTRSYTQRVCT